MALQDRNYAMGAQATTSAAMDEGLRSYMLRVYNYMASGVALTGLVALLINTVPALNAMFYTATPQGYAQPSMLVWGSMILSVGLVFLVSFRVNHMQASTVQTIFWAYAALNGIWMSTILETYTSVSVVRVFFITAASFAGLSLFGYTTKKDLSGFGSFLIMGLIGILIASVVNIFLGSSMLHWMISVVGVLVFAGLTAYDTQKIKNMYLEADGAEIAAKKSVMGALTLYLDFINLFIMLMRLFGERR